MDSPQAGLYPEEDQIKGISIHKVKRQAPTWEHRHGTLQQKLKKH